MRKIGIILFLLLGYVCRTYGQNNDTTKNVDIDIKANTVIYTKTDSSEYHRFIGDAVFIQGTDTLYCDSLYKNSTTKNIEAFSNVKMLQQGGTKAQSDYLRYTSGKKLAYMRDNVSLTDGKNVLKCSELTYDLSTKIGVYDKGGVLTTDSTTVSSIEGEYKVNTKEARFKRHVYVKDIRYDIVSEDLGYNTITKLVTFFAKSVITSDSGKSILKTSNGTYESITGTAHFIGHSSVFNKDHYLEGDSIYYDKLTGYGNANGNVISIDTTHHSTLYCSHLEYFKVQRILWATGKPVLQQINGKDTLYIRADTFYSHPIAKAVIKNVKSKAIVNNLSDSALTPADSILLDIERAKQRKVILVRKIDSLKLCVDCQKVEQYVLKHSSIEAKNIFDSTGIVNKKIIYIDTILGMLYKYIDSIKINEDSLDIKIVELKKLLNQCGVPIAKLIIPFELESIDNSGLIETKTPMSNFGEKLSTLNNTQEQQKEDINEPRIPYIRYINHQNVAKASIRPEIIRPVVVQQKPLINLILPENLEKNNGFENTKVVRTPILKDWNDNTEDLDTVIFSMSIKDTFAINNDISYKKEKQIKDVKHLKSDSVLAKQENNSIVINTKTKGNKGFELEKKVKNQKKLLSASKKPKTDSVMADTTAPLVFIGYHHVKIFSDSLQGLCDSISYSQQDSLIRMIFAPIAWSHLSQITGDTIYLKIDDSGGLKNMYVPNNSFVVSQSGPEKAQLYDQIQGKTLTGFFVNNNITKMIVVPDAESIYYSKDEKGAYVGESEAKSEKMKIYFVDRQINKIFFEKDVNQVLTPMEKVDIPSARLSRFKWLMNKRPKSKKELFE